MNVLLLNAGSSSLKATLMRAGDNAVLAQGSADWAGSTTRYRYQAIGQEPSHEFVAWRGHSSTVQRFVTDLCHGQSAILPDRANLAAIGHRIVHGGPFTSPVRVTSEVRARIQALTEIAPLHNPPSLEALEAAEVEFPTTPQVAVFDTAFHATLPPAAYTYAVPEAWTRDWGIRRYGFHGLSHAYCSRRAAEMLGRPLSDVRSVVCHLGHGCSAAAIDGGRSIETTMGFTPLDGLMMATRSGSLDPGVVLFVQQQYGLTAEQVEDALNRESGLRGVSGVSADMREVLAASHDGQPKAQLALAMYARRIRLTIGAMAVALGRVDALVFTAGVGEHSCEVRRLVCQGLDSLGLILDTTANDGCTPDADIATRDSRGRILVIATREDMTMLQEVLSVLNRTEGIT